MLDDIAELHSAEYTVEVFNDLLNSNRDSWRAEPEIDFVTWLDTYFILTPEGSAVASKWKTRPFQRAMCFSMADLDIPIFIECKPAQVGATKRLVGYYGYTVRERMRNLGLWQPTGEDVGDFIDVQISPMLKSCPRVAEAMIGGSDPDTQNKYNAKGKKQFKWSVAYARSAHAARGFRGITLDDAILDDYDGMPRKLREGGKDIGSPRSRAWLRTRTSTNRKLFLVSTPTEAGLSQIWEAAQSAEELFERFVPCLKCGTMQTLHFSGVADAEHGLTWSSSATDKAASAVYRCANNKCQHDHIYSQMREMDALGQWRSKALAQSDSDGSFWLLGANGKPTKKRPKRKPREIAYWYNALISYEEGWEETVRFYLHALDLFERTQDDSELVVFDNEYLGIAHDRRSQSRHSVSELISRLENYESECPQLVQYITIGVDIGKTFFDYEVVGWGAERRNWSLETGVLPCNTSDPHDPGWKRLANLLDKRFERDDGVKVQINLAFIDARFLPDNIKLFCAEEPYQRVACQGQPNHNAQMLSVTRQPIQEGCFLARMGATKATQRVYDMLAVDEPESAGYCTFPRAPQYFSVDEETGEIQSDFFEQFTAEELVVQSDGNMRSMKRKGRKNEKHDNRKLALCAFECLMRQGYELLSDEEWMSQRNVEETDDAYQLGLSLGSQ